MYNSNITLKGCIIISLYLIVYNSFCITVNAQTGTDFSGSYQSHTNTGNIELNLTQSYEGVATGDLKGADGTEFKIEGEFLEGGLAGVCFNNDIYVYFEAEFEQENLNFFLIEPDVNNMPDYNQVSQLIFTKPAKALQQQKPSGQIAVKEEKQNKTAKQSNSQNLSTKTVTDPSWGYNVFLPEAWNYQINGNRLIIGHEKIAGMIICIPHHLKNISEVRQTLNEGLSEEGTYLYLIGNIQTISSNILSGDYQGTMEMNKVKAKAYGTLSPYGGGAFLISVTTPELYSNDLENAALQIANNLQYSKLETSGLMQHFAGKWTRHSKYSSTSIYFGADGTFSKNYESSYQGDFHDEYGAQTGYWSTLGQSNSQGNWTVRGTKDQGQIIINMNDGSQTVYNYKVNIENGKVYYSDYFLNGDFYHKQ